MIDTLTTECGFRGGCVLEANHSRGMKCGGFVEGFLV
jgi:hypothetical protein